MDNNLNDCKPDLTDLGALSAQRKGHVNGSKMGVLLGIVTKTSSPLEFKGLRDDQKSDFIDFETGEITPEKSDFSSPLRSKRFALKSAVNEILTKTRTSKCMRLRAPDNFTKGLRDIEILKSSEHGKAFYQGLITCGSVWHCPVCAAKISERRRIELKSGMQAAKDLGYKAHFVTLTIPHGVGDDINVMLEGLRGANRRLSSGKYSIKSQLKKIDPDLEIVGFIRALEVTHGKNGFHPHFHIIVFTNADFQTSFLAHLYKKAWKRACIKSGLPEPNEHGCDVKDGSFASEYVSKWGIEDEMTKANSKISKQKGKSPWGLLDAFLSGTDLDYSSDRAKSLFLVYANAFKGQRQLYWSNGLRKMLDIESEMTDREIAELPEDASAFFLAEIPFDDWKLVLKNKREAELLSVAEQNALAIKPYLAALK